MTPLAYFLTFVTDTQAQEAAREILTFLAYAGVIAAWLRLLWWIGGKIGEAGERQRQLADLELLYCASVKWTRERDAKLARTQEQPAEPFMLDEHDLTFQLRRSIQLAKRQNRKWRRDNDAA